MDLPDTIFPVRGVYTVVPSVWRTVMFLFWQYCFVIAGRLNIILRQTVVESFWSFDHCKRYYCCKQPNGSILKRNKNRSAINLLPYSRAKFKRAATADDELWGGGMVVSVRTTIQRVHTQQNDELSRAHTTHPSETTGIVSLLVFTRKSLIDGIIRMWCGHWIDPFESTGAIFRKTIVSAWWPKETRTRVQVRVGCVCTQYTNNNMI